MIKILAVDDDPLVGRTIKRSLERKGHYTVSVASDGASGIRKARRWQPDVMLLDVTMPGMDGIEVLRKMGESDRTRFIPVIMVTAMSDPATKSSASEQYADGYVVKPFQIDEVLAAIQRVLRTRRRPFRQGALPRVLEAMRSWMRGGSPAARTAGGRHPIHRPIPRQEADLDSDRQSRPEEGAA